MLLRLCLRQGCGRAAAAGLWQGCGRLLHGCGMAAAGLWQGCCGRAVAGLRATAAAELWQLLLLHLAAAGLWAAAGHMHMVWWLPAAMAVLRCHCGTAAAAAAGLRLWVLRQLPRLCLRQWRRRRKRRRHDRRGRRHDGRHGPGIRRGNGSSSGLGLGLGLGRRCRAIGKAAREPEGERRRRCRAVGA